MCDVVRSRQERCTCERCRSQKTASREHCRPPDTASQQQFPSPSYLHLLQDLLSVILISINENGCDVVFSIKPTRKSRKRSRDPRKISGPRRRVTERSENYSESPNPLSAPVLS